MLHIKGDYVCCSHMEYCHFIYYFKAWNTAVRKQCTHAHKPEERFKCLLLTYTLGFHHLGCQRLMRHHLIGQNDPGWNYGCHQNRRLPYSPLSMCDVEEIKLVWVDDSTKKRLIGWRGNSHTPRQTERENACVIWLTWKREFLRVAVEPKEICQKIEPKGFQSKQFLKWSKCFLHQTPQNHRLTLPGRAFLPVQCSACYTCNVAVLFSLKFHFWKVLLL